VRLFGALARSSGTPPPTLNARLSEKSIHIFTDTKLCLICKWLDYKDMENYSQNGAFSANLRVFTDLTPRDRSKTPATMLTEK
jgi:hypothetical protein